MVQHWPRTAREDQPTRRVLRDAVCSSCPQQHWSLPDLNDCSAHEMRLFWEVPLEVLCVLGSKGKRSLCDSSETFFQVLLQIVSVELLITHAVRNNLRYQYSLLETKSPIRLPVG